MIEVTESDKKLLQDLAVNLRNGGSRHNREQLVATHREAAAKAERNRIVAWLRDQDGHGEWYEAADALEGEQHVDVLEAAFPSVGTNGLYVCDSLGLSCTVIGHVEGWLEVKFHRDQSTCIVRPSRFNPQGSQP